MRDSWFSGSSSLSEWVSRPRERYAEWQEPRPVLGGALLILGGMMIGYVPIQFASELMLIGGTYTIIGLVFAVLVSFCGLAVLVKPHLSTLIGALGVILATLSLLGALGGLFVGMIVATAGGVLCYAWEPPAGYEQTTISEAASGFVWQDDASETQQETEFSWEGDDEDDQFEI